MSKAPPDTEPADTKPSESSSVGDFLREVARAPSVEPRPCERDRTGETFGHFQLTGLLGRGGMGVVYAAFDLTLRRKVALKLMRSTVVESERQRWRLLREAQAAAAASHPNIAAVFEIGEVDGEVFIAMELVEGPDLRAWLAARPRSTREILDVFIMAGRGLAAAHRTGLIHRDFKPDNVLVDAVGRARVADFGLAAGVETGSEPFSMTEVFPGSGLTQAGRVAGTAGYIAPEHLAGRAADARSDQFAFCVALHEAFEGRRPYEPPELEAFAQGKSALPRPRFRRTPLWLRRLLARGLAPDPDRRFPHMETLLSRMERARALPRRAALSLGVAMVASAGLLLALRTTEADARAETKARQERNATRMSVARELYLRDPTTALGLLREVEPPDLPRGWSELARRALQAGVARVVLRHPGTVGTVAWSPDGRRLLTASKGKAAWVWNADGTGQPLALRGHEDTVFAAAWSPDGLRVATASADLTVRVHSADGAGEPLVLRGHTGWVRSAAWSPDGTRIVTASNDDTARVWRADGTGQPLVLRGHESAVLWAAWSPDGARLATSSNDRTVRVWRADGTGKPLILRGHELAVWSVAFSPDGTRIVTASSDETARIWRADGTGQPLVLRGHEAGLGSAAWSPDGARVLTASDDKTARVWLADGTGQPLVLRGHELGVMAAAWSPDGARIATASEDTTARVWRADGTGRPIILRGHDRAVLSVAWSPDGKRIATGSEDTTARVWRADGAGEPIALRGPWDAVRSVAWSPDGTRVVTASQSDKAVRVWNADGTGQPLELHGHEQTVWSAAWSRDGTRIVTTSHDGTGRVWRADGTGEPLVLRGHDGAISSAAFSPDGARIVTVSGKTVRVWNADGTGSPLVFRGHEEFAGSVAFSPDGARIVTASEKAVHVWSADGTGEPLVLSGAEQAFNSAAFSPDGLRIAAASDDRTVWVWADLEPLRGVDDPRLWSATSYCMSAERRVAMLNVSEATARAGLEACERRVEEARAAAAGLR